MIPTNPRELEKILRRMGIKVEEVDAACVEIGRASCRERV